MNGLNIIQIAREADLLTTTEPNGYQVWIPENLERFAELVAAAEREACAEVAEKHFTYYGYQYIADDIRARGNNAA